jgi:hypothetical protein
MGDIIDLKARRKDSVDLGNEHESKTPVMDITNLRRQQIEYDRREAKRTILSGFIGASVLVQGRGLLKVSVFDISDGGISFDMHANAGHFREGEELAVRFYFSQKVYFPFFVKVSSVRVNSEEGVIRHGAQFVQERTNMMVLQQFIEFLEAVVVDLKNDNGDLFINDFGG